MAVVHLPHHSSRNRTYTPDMQQLFHEEALFPNDRFRKSKLLGLVPDLRGQTCVLLPSSTTLVVGFYRFPFQIERSLLLIFIRNKCKILSSACSMFVEISFQYDFSFLAFTIVSTL